MKTLDKDSATLLWVLLMGHLTNSFQDNLSGKQVFSQTISTVTPLLQLEKLLLMKKQDLLEQWSLLILI